MPDYDSPRTVFTSAVGLLAAEDFDLVADCVDPAWLPIFAAELVEGVRNSLGPGAADTSGPSTSNARDIFVRWLREISPRTKIERLVSDGRIKREAADALCHPRPPTIPVELVGTVLEDDRFAHLLFRTKIGSPKESWLAQFANDEREVRRDQWMYGQVSIVAARRQRDGTWRLIPSRFFLGFDREHAFGLAE